MASLADYGISCKYGRDEVDYGSWYSEWMRSLALRYSLPELNQMLIGARSDAGSAARSHLRAIEATHSMAGNSMRRAHSRNVTAAAGDTAIAIRGAIEIHFLFPEHAKANDDRGAHAAGGQS